MDAITDWAQHHAVAGRPSRAVGGEVLAGRGGKDGIHWNFEAHRAVAALVLQALSEAGVAVEGR